MRDNLDIQVETLLAANPADAERWNTFVANSPTPDVYYLPAYAEAAAEIDPAEPGAVVAGRVSGTFLTPRRLRGRSTVGTIPKSIGPTHLRPMVMAAC